MEAYAKSDKMKIYACEKCGKEFDQKSHYDAHAKKKNPCVHEAALEKRLEGILRKIEPADAAAEPQAKTDKMADVIKTKEQQQKFFEALHNLLWNDAGLNPEKALEHMTFFFAYRLIERQADTLGLPQECRWSYLANLKDKQILFEEMKKGIIAFNKNKKTKPFFKPHEIKKIDTLYNIVKEINRLDVDTLQETDTLGDIFEHMLARGMSTMADEGQYFTMRAICKLAFKLSYSVKQRVRREDGTLMTFADFFCGTGGFPAEFVKGVNQVEGKKVDWAKDCESIYCLDKNVSSVMTTLLNMLILTGIPFSDKKIREYNSFQDNISKGHNAVFKDLLVDYCFMNPPYGGDKTKGKEYKFKYAILDKETKTKHYRVNEDIQSIGIEDDDKVSAGVQLAMATLAPGGVCAIVLPQGFFFGATKKAVELRKRLAEEHKIWYVVDIASGAFANTGTKTSMVVFQRGVGATEKIAFMDMDEKILVEASLEDLCGKSYSLNYKMYLPQDVKELEGFETKKLSEIASDITFGFMISSNDYNTVGVPVVKTKNIKSKNVEYPSNEQRIQTVLDDRYKVKKGDLLIVLGGSPGENGIWNYSETAWLNQDCANIKISNEITKKYVFYMLETENIKKYIASNITKTTIPHISRGVVRDIPIPLPSLEKQQEIVDAIDGFTQLAHAEEEALKLLEKQVMFEVKWMGQGKERMKLGDLCDVKCGKPMPKSNIIEGTIPVIGGGISPMGFHNTSTHGSYTPIISQRGTAGHISRYPTNTWITPNAVIPVRKDNNLIVNDDMLFYILKNEQFSIDNIVEKTAQPLLTIGNLKDIKIAIPSLAEQETLLADFEEIRHKYEKIAHYKAKAQEAIHKHNPDAGVATEELAQEVSETEPVSEKKAHGPSKIKSRAPTV